ncbi:hypothetical protein DH2020_020198 [Rehmannia glutinosa]|uniref:Uncharacterized protein n=1 Tax=Rehmannia glutinosa TaxID=99300 RepID=A0ABR0WJP8_REHGL
MEKQSCAENNNIGKVDIGEDTVHIVTVKEFSQLLESQPRKWQPGSRRPHQMHKAPPELRLRRQQSEHVYDPVLVSLGPYHHGKPELRRVEEFKYLCLDWFAEGNEEKKAFLYNKVFEKIDVIRSCYAETTIVDKYDDKALALMMLLDACFIINLMKFISEETENNLDWVECLGEAASSAFMLADIMLLENQIPFLVLKLLISLRYEKTDEAEELVESFICWITTVDLNLAKIPRENEDPPIHILEACWRVLVQKHNNIEPKFQGSEKSLTRRKKNHNNVSYTCRSAMDLKAKGIHFSPSSTQSLMDITFKSYPSYGRLKLPIRYVSDRTQVVFSNMIAYEVSPNSKTKPAVLSYVNLMKSVIQSPADVKELQEKGILFNRLANHEQAVKVFKEIDMFGYVDFDIFDDVKQRIEEHCKSKAKTWIVDLIHTWFRTPWTAIALFAATFLLCLTFLQTYFTIRPVK